MYRSLCIEMILFLPCEAFPIRLQGLECPTGLERVIARGLVGYHVHANNWNIQSHVKRAERSLRMFEYDLDNGLTCTEIFFARMFLKHGTLGGVG